MASLTMMASLSVAVDQRVHQVQQPRRLAVVARAAKVDQVAEPAGKEYISAVEGRRAVVFAAAAAALSAIGGGSGAAFAADPDVKRGTPEAKKKYATVCVAMPTAKICHN